MALDYQWPKALLNKAVGVKADSKQIEDFFQKISKVPFVLAPKGRTAIHWLMEWKNINRTHQVFAPLWTSECVWSQITPFANPTTNFQSTPDFIINVHKYGIIHRAEKIEGERLLENSIDTSFTPSTDLFPNGGAFALVSLPKITASNMGGLLFFRHENTFSEFSKWLNEKYPWRNEEFKDFQTPMALSESFQLNQQTIERRLKNLKTLLRPQDYLAPGPARLPPVIAIPILDSENPPESVMVRHLDVNKNIRDPRFQRCALIPLHFGVDDASFESCSETLLKLLKRR